MPILKVALDVVISPPLTARSPVFVWLPVTANVPPTLVAEFAPPIFTLFKEVPVPILVVVPLTPTDEAPILTVLPRLVVDVFPPIFTEVPVDALVEDTPILVWLLTPAVVTLLIPTPPAPPLTTVIEPEPS